ncbi:hypothetical protein [Streptomyces flavofungini]|uniref:Uncharacterized protein n=1 Tax=Streptomyces flavofungini TaxID=68200 RepID=A0ABS0XIB9_9ACTN|nr:hypothetical protein [Streptomyces flavofungini]MBJ3812948.1 hypothetical protein [Streptomyces flavofungini]GHC84458.1 hypothetical protein GCM10010349_69510 [Streptomyces flavofungini]
MTVSTKPVLKHIRTAATVVAIGTAATLVGPAPSANAAPSASAGDRCRPPLCSQTWNDSGKGFYALKNWCKSTGTTGSYTTKKPTCNNQKRNWLRPGERTKGTQDWDVFQVKKGRCFKVDFQLTPGRDFSKKYNRKNKKTIYVKVANNAFAKVRSSTC